VHKITQKLSLDFHTIWGIGRLWTGEELIQFLSNLLLFQWLIDVKVKVKVTLGKPVTAQYGKYRPVCLLLPGNDTVPVLMIWSGGGMHSAGCSLVNAHILVILTLRFYVCTLVTLIASRMVGTSLKVSDLCGLESNSLASLAG